ncbi:MAG TPA: type II secretion system F family protein [Alphaproteobacteria bacterium]|nr:type II secretion system F family protein [Alphaproteobacteria bacterium]
MAAPAATGNMMASFGGSGGRATISPRDRERLFFFMAMMMKTGQTTADSLRSVAKAFRSEKQEGIASALMGIAQKVSQGKSLSQSMLGERQMFSDVHRAAILAGEASNNMQKSFEVLRVLEDKAIASSRAGMSEMLTPLLMLVLSCVSIFNTGLNTLPVMVKLQESQGKPIGLLPGGIMYTTQFCAHYWYLFVAVLVVFGIVIFTLYGSPQGRGTLDKMKLAMPIYGRYLTYHTYNQMLLYFPYLIASGVKPKQLIPIMEALTTNTVLKRKIDAFNHVITTGGTLAEAMTRAGFPELIVTPVSVAEHYAPTDGNVNDVLIEGMNHAHNILERILVDTHSKFIAVFSSILWVLGGAVMMLDMLSIVMSQA